MACVYVEFYLGNHVRSSTVYDRPEEFLSSKVSEMWGQSKYLVEMIILQVFLDCCNISGWWLGCAQSLAESQDSQIGSGSQMKNGKDIIHFNYKLSHIYSSAIPNSG